VSPIARIAIGDCSGRGLMPPKVVGYVTDGGIYDSSGASTAVGRWRARLPQIASSETPQSCVAPLFLQIDNSVADDAGNTTKRPPFEAISSRGGGA
jgi:hypothetical protein